MRVIGTKRDPGSGGESADDVFSNERLGEILPLADFVALTCPLTPQTEGLINAQALARMKPSAYLINVARGKVVDEAALIVGAERRPHRGRRARLHGRGAAAERFRRSGTFRMC